MLLKIMFPSLGFICLADSNKAVMDKVFYYVIMKNISIIKSSSDIDTDDPYIIDSYMSVSLSS